MSRQSSTHAWMSDSGICNLEERRSRKRSMYRFQRNALAAKPKGMVIEKQKPNPGTWKPVRCWSASRRGMER